MKELSTIHFALGAKTRIPARWHVPKVFAPAVRGAHPEKPKPFGTTSGPTTTDRMSPTDRSPPFDDARWRGVWGCLNLKPWLNDS